VAPAGTPKAIVNLLNATINEGLKSKENQETIARIGAVSNLGSPEEFAAFIAAQHRKWLDVAKTAHVKID
jgi:tripartite-type tricarboxylate transporter receptor subunit TctC